MGACASRMARGARERRGSRLHLFELSIVSQGDVLRPPSLSESITGAHSCAYMNLAREEATSSVGKRIARR